MEHDILTRIYECLENLEHYKASEQYEYGGFYTVGGTCPVAPGATTFLIRSPFNTECEWSPVCLSAEGQRIYCMVSDVGEQPIPDVTGTLYGVYANNSGNQNGGADNNAIPGLFFLTPANSCTPFSQHLWLPLTANGLLWINMSANSTGSPGFFTATFRRSLVHTIPSQPRTYPHTHHIQSRAPQRRLNAQSPMTAGFASRTIPGQTYNHQYDLPQQDTGVSKRGTFPLGRIKQKG